MRKTKRFMVVLLAAVLLGGCGGKTDSPEKNENIVEEYKTTDQKNEENEEFEESEDNKEYSYSDLEGIKDMFWDLYVKETNKLSEAELFGTSDDEEESNEHYLKASMDCANKIFSDNKDIPAGQAVIVIGYIDNVREMDEDTFFVRKGAENIIFNLKHNAEDDEYSGFSCRTSDETILELENNTPVKIEGVFLKPDMIGSNNDLYNCKIIEHGKPEDVNEKPLMTAAPSFN